MALFKIDCYPGFGENWKATVENPAQVYVSAKDAEEAKKVAQYETAKHCYEPFQIFSLNEIDYFPPSDSEILSWKDTFGEDENHRVVIAAKDFPLGEAPPSGTGEPAQHVCLTKITSDVKKHLAGAGQDITGL